MEVTLSDMETKVESVDKGSAEVGLVSTDMSLGFRESSEAPVLSDLLKDVPRLMSEEPGEILRFFVDINAIYDLNLVPDKIFWLKVLPKTKGSLLTFLGQSMKDGESWNICKTRLLREYFPLFVKEKMIRELVVFNFQEKGRPMGEFIKEVTDAAEFLQYNASEADIVERVLMNLHPDILAQAALLPRPVTFQELRYTVGLIEERMAVLAERKRLEGKVTGAQGPDRFSRGSDKQKGSAVSSQQANRGGPKCCKCNRWGHFQRDCKKGNSSGTVAVISAVRDQSTHHISPQDIKMKVCSDQTIGSNEHKDVIIDSQHKHGVVESKKCADSLTGNKHKSEVMGSTVKQKGPKYPQRKSRQGTKGKQMVGKAESPSNPPLWEKLDFKTVHVPSLVDTGAQFSCMRKDVVESLIDLGLKVKKSELGWHVT